MDMVGLLMRLMHIASAVVLVGGLFFFVTGVLPVLKAAPGTEDSLAAIRKRFFRLAHPAIVLLILSGAWQWWQNHAHYKLATGPLLQALLGTKVLLAIVAFAIAFAAPTGVLPGCPGRWARANLVLGLLILVLASAVRGLHMGLIEPGTPAVMP